MIAKNIKNPVFFLLLCFSFSAGASNIESSAVVSFKAVVVKNSFNNISDENNQTSIKAVSSSLIKNEEYLLFEKNKVSKKIILPTEENIKDYYWCDN